MKNCVNMNTGKYLRHNNRVFQVIICRTKSIIIILRGNLTIRINLSLLPKRRLIKSLRLIPPKHYYCNYCTTVTQPMITTFRKFHEKFNSHETRNEIKHKKSPYIMTNPIHIRIYTRKTFFFGHNWKKKVFAYSGK